MKTKISMSFLFVIFIFSCTKETKPIDLLYYTSPLILTSKNNIKAGSANGFFIRKNGSLFLITNYHVFAGKNTMDKKDNDQQFDTLKFAYSETNGNLRFGSIILKDINAKSKNYYFFEHPDIYVYKLSNEFYNNQDIRSIEKFMNPIHKGTDYPNNIWCYSTVNGALKIMNFQLYNTAFDNFKMQYGPQRLDIELKNSYFLTPQGEQGMSGTPVFYEYYNTKEFVFGGVVSSQIPLLNVELIVKPDEVIKMVDSLLR
jgi:hypothetical protein